MKVTKLSKRNTPAMALVITPTAIFSLIIQLIFFLLQFSGFGFGFPVLFF